MRPARVVSLGAAFVTVAMAANRTWVRAPRRRCRLAPTVLERALHGPRTRVRAARFKRRWGFEPPPPWSDWVGYETLLDELDRHGIDKVEGDLLEIGALLGGGTAKLC